MTKKTDQSAADILRQKAEMHLHQRKAGACPGSATETDMLKLIHELEVHQVQLEMQNDELRDARIQAEAATDKYTSLYEFAPSGYCTLSQSGEIVEINITGTQMLGRDRSTIMHQHFTDFISPDTRPVFNIFLEKIFQIKTKESCEVKLSVNGDIPMFVLLTGVIAEDPNWCNITMVDITRGRQLEERLLLINKAFESAGDAIGISDARGHHIYQNKALSELFEYDTAEELQEAGGGQKVVRDPEVGREMFNAIMSGKPWSGELEMVTKSGKVFPAYERADAITNRDGNIVGLIGVITDITKRKQIEESHRVISEFNESLLQTIPFGMDIVDEIGNILFLSEKMKQHFGADAIGKKCWDLYRDDKKQCFDCPLHTGINVGETKTYETNGVLDGKTFEIYHTGIIFNGQKAMLEAFIDITERKLVENTQSFLLRCGLPGTGEDFFDSLAHYLSQTLNMEYVCIDRLEGDGLTAQTVSIYNEGRFESNERYALKDTPCGEVVDRSVCCYRKGVRHLFPDDKALHDLNAESYVGTTLIDSKGKAIGLIAIIGHQPLHEEGRAKELLKLVAIRAAGELERREVENEIRLLNETLEHRIAERTKQFEALNKELTFHLSELEQFTYVSNHDLQEPLRTLTQFTQLFNEKYAGTLDEEGEKYLEFIGRSAVRMSALVKDLLDYSLLGQESAMTKVDLNTVVEAALNDLADSITVSNAKITVQEMPTLNGYETELRLMFQNLIGNAIKYQGPGIVPVVNVSVIGSETEWLFSVRDNGIGIDQKHFEKIFIIFQRLHNRSEYEGTGIGLAHCKKIAELHGGRIWVESMPGEGSTFIFPIPRR